MTVTSTNVDPYKRRELFADPPRIPTPALLADQARARQQRIRSEAARARRAISFEEDSE